MRDLVPTAIVLFFAFATGQQLTNKTAMQSLVYQDVRTQFGLSAFLGNSGN